MTRFELSDGTCPLRHQVDVWVHRRDGRRVPARLQTSDDGIELEVFDVSVLSGLATDACWTRRAEELAAHGLTVRVTHDGMHLLTLGAQYEAERCTAPIRPGRWPDGQ